MNKALCLALLVVGIILLIYGQNASNSVASSVTNAVSGKPTDKTIWLTVLGVIGIVVGGAGFFLGRRDR